MGGLGASVSRCWGSLWLQGCFTEASLVRGTCLMSPSSFPTLLGLLQASRAQGRTSSLPYCCMSLPQGRALGPSSCRGHGDFQQDIAPNGNMRVRVGACWGTWTQGSQPPPMFPLKGTSHCLCVPVPSPPPPRVAPLCAFLVGLHQ